MNNLSRRNIVKSAAWAAPVIVATATVPAYAASIEKPKSGFPVALPSSMYKDSSNKGVLALTETSRGTITPSYGDWNTNSDSYSGIRTNILEINKNTGSINDFGNFGSEAFTENTVRGGHVYAPMIDSSSKTGGYWTDESGSWQWMEVNKNIVHAFDVDTYGGKTYVATNSGAVSGATIYEGTPSAGFKAIYNLPGDWSRVYHMGIDQVSGNLYATIGAKDDKSTGVTINLKSGEQKLTKYNDGQAIIDYRGRTYIGNWNGSIGVTEFSLADEPDTILFSAPMLYNDINSVNNEGDTFFAFGRKSLGKFTPSGIIDVFDLTKFKPQLATDESIISGIVSGNEVFVGTNKGFVYKLPLI